MVEEVEEGDGSEVETGDIDAKGFCDVLDRGFPKARLQFFDAHLAKFGHHFLLVDGDDTTIRKKHIAVALLAADLVCSSLESFFGGDVADDGPYNVWVYRAVFGSHEGVFAPAEDIDGLGTVDDQTVCDDFADAGAAACDDGDEAVDPEEGLGRV